MSPDNWFNQICCQDQFDIIQAELCATGEKQEVDRWTVDGLFRESRGFNTATNYEEATTDAIAYIKADSEPVEALSAKLVGQYVEYDGDTYRIESITKGKDYTCCEILFYKLFMIRGCIGC